MILALLVGSFFLINKKSDIRENSYDAIPQDAAVILELPDFQEFVNKLEDESLLWKEFQTIRNLQIVNDNILFLDSLVRSNKSLNILFSGAPLLVTFHLTGRDNVQSLFLINIKGKFSRPGALQTVLKKTFSPDFQVKERLYHKTKITKLVSSNGNKQYSYAIYKKILMFSSSEILLESALRQTDLKENFTHTRGFEIIKKTAGKNSTGNIYINFKNLSGLLNPFVEKKFRSQISGLENFADWAELDLNIKNNQTLLNGFSYSNKNSKRFLNLFTGNPARNFGMDMVLPSNTVTCIEFGISDFDRFYIAYKNYLHETGEFASHLKKIKKAKSIWNLNFEKLFLPLLENEIGVAFTDIKNVTLPENSFVLMGVKSLARSQEELLKALNRYLSKTDKSSKKFIQTIEIDPQTSFPVYQLPVSGIPEILFGRLFKGASYRFVTFVDHYLVFGNSPSSLSTFVHDYVLQKILNNDIDYRNFKESLSGKSNFFIYSDIASSSEILNRYLNQDLRNGLKKNAKVFRKIQAVGWQFSSENELVYNNLLIKYRPVYKERAVTQWESLLDTTLRSKPALVMNHYTHEKEIFIQDEKNNIYLINSTGRVLWKLNLPEKIMSEIYQIDYYRNRKLQIMFNTRNYLHLIDRNGNYVEKYPKKLRSPATNGMALFDYDKTRNYRICIAGEDKKIYLFDKYGKTVKGWTFPKTEEILSSTVFYFRIDNKDYIVYPDKLKLYIVDRKGKTRIDIKENIPKALHPNIIADRQNLNFRWVTTGVDGKVYFINRNGEVKIKNFGTFLPSHFFDLKDLNGDGTKEYIFVDNDRLVVYNSSGKKVFDYVFGQKISLKPVIYTFASNDQKIGIVSSNEHKIYLFNNNGKVYKNFPLTGQTLFSIGKFKGTGSGFNLIVGGENNFLYNYFVQYEN